MQLVDTGLDAFKNAVYKEGEFIEKTVTDVVTKSND